MIDAAVAPGQRSRVRSRHRCPAPRLLRSFPHVPGSDTLQARVERALAQLKHPRHGKDVLSAGMVRELSVDGAGQVTFTFILAQQDPPTLAREARKAVQGVEGVTAVRVNLTDAGAAPGAGWGGEPGVGGGGGGPSLSPRAKQPPPPRAGGPGNAGKGGGGVPGARSTPPAPGPPPGGGGGGGAAAPRQAAPRPAGGV